MSLRASSDPRGIFRWFVLIAAGIIGLAGYFGPWVPHRAAGLVVTGLDLGEYVKFLPGFTSGQTAFRREIFYAPLLAASLTAGWLASRRELPGWSRIILGAGAIPLALAMLPPAWSPATLRSNEFRLQVIAIAACLGMVVALPALRFLPPKVILAPIALLALTAALLPFWGFVQVRPAIAELYGHPIPIGWGAWVCLAAYLALGFFAVAELMRRAQRAPSRQLRRL